MAEEHRYLKLVGISGKETLTRPPLKEVYVSLHVGSAQGGDDAAADRSLTVAQALSEHGNLLILGEPGAGKSTLLDWLILVFCREIPQPALQNIGDLLPIYLPLRACADDERPLAQMMADATLLPLSLPAPDSFFADRLKSGRCLVLLDGLDEVIDQTARDRVAEKIKRLVRAYPNNRFVVTCRTAGWEERLLPAEFTRVLIRDFDPADTRRFVAGWYRAVLTQKVLVQRVMSEEGRRRAMADAERRADREAQALIETLEDNLGLAELARNPMILSLIALVHSRRTKLPEGRAKLYQECLEILLEVWDREDKEFAADSMSLNAKETVLKQIAYDFHHRAVTESDAQHLERLIAPLLPDLDCSLSASEVLRQIEERSGILVERALDRYVFAHRTLQEYLTAKTLAAAPNRYGEILQHLHDEPWREVILLYVGLIDDATPLVRSILRQPDDESCNLLFLAGQCLIEDVRVEEAVRTDVVSALERSFRESNDPLSLERLGRTLAAIGGTDVVELFGRVLGEGTAQQQVGAARALGRLGAKLTRRDAVGRQLAQALTAAESRLRRAAALALADLGSPDSTILAALAKARQDKDEEVRGAALWALLELGQAEQLGMAPVPAGEFDMGSDDDDTMADDDEKPKHRLYLDKFYIARYPVTNAEFARFVEATGYQARYSWQEYAGKGRENHPVVHVTWHDACAYASWIGAHLPSEAQWEKAASWDAQQGVKLLWPWGDTWDARRCNHGKPIPGLSEPRKGFLNRLRRKRRGGQGMPPTTPVGSFSPLGDSRCGAADMSGNVWEWCSSAFESYPYHPDDGREDLQKESLRVLRGGSWWNDRTNVRCAFRGWNNPDGRNVNLGFRVARGSLM
jgi:formylglycine-generating enzyme required for sulfatase activity